ncbi:F-box only protein 42 [Atheta coriaria]|uniref:F-box only protein 42 n=1 Tax=Dalotia coriaria TaxID=877792 RepID=UPI0031F3C9D8
MIESAATTSAPSKELLSIEDLPDEVLEFVLGFLPPYKDIHDCMLVSKRWRRCVRNVIKIKRRNLNKAINDFDIVWKTITPAAMAPTITKRYSHSAAVHDNSMYVFGGCTCSMTTFNDLWRLDLSKRLWVRPLTMGTYPSPKACSTMVCYKDSLVLFGGWTYPPSYPLHQSWHLFNELHTYDIKANRWTCINTAVTPPPTAGHSVSIHGNWMVIFGGLQRASNVVHSTKTNDIWKLNLETWNWYKQETFGHLKPQERYGQSQTVLDDENVLIMGGSGGPQIFFSDIWILNMKGNHWKWIKVEVRNSHHAPPNLWCNPVCKIEDKLIVLSKSRQNPQSPFMFISRGVWTPPVDPRGDNRGELLQRRPGRIDMADRVVDHDENVNGRRGTLKGVKRNNAGDEAERQMLLSDPNKPGPSGAPEPNERMGLAAFNDPNVDVDQKMNARRLLRQEKMKLSEEKLKAKLCIAAKHKAKEFSKPKKNVLGMYVLDVAHALDSEPYVTWMPIKDPDLERDGPEETMLYTFVSGKSELIMFGGIHKDDGSLIACTTNLSQQVSNSLHFITAPRYVI